MSDSEANQAAYPQHGNQQKGCGFPIARVVVFFSLLTGAVVSACISRWKTSETEMSRLLYKQLDPEDVAMADQLHGSYVDLALIRQQGADGMIRKHHARKTDFRKGQKNGIGDHQVEWSKPTRRPKHMSQEEFDALPKTMMVREVSLRLTRQGWPPNRSGKHCMLICSMRLQRIYCQNVLIDKNPESSNSAPNHFLECDNLALFSKLNWLHDSA